MNAPASDKFAAVDLSTTFNADRDELDDTLRLVRRGDQYYGDQVFQGVPSTVLQSPVCPVVLLSRPFQDLPLQHLLIQVGTCRKGFKPLSGKGCLPPPSICRRALCE